MVQNKTGEYLSPEIEMLYLYSEGVLCESLEKEYGLGNGEEYTSPDNLFEIF